MFLVPAQGRQVADPDRGDHLPAEGREVEFTQYWQRRVADGDVVVGQISAAEPSAKKKG